MTERQGDRGAEKMRVVESERQLVREAERKRDRVHRDIETDRHCVPVSLSLFL